MVLAGRKRLDGMKAGILSVEKVENMALAGVPGPVLGESRQY
jgi:hypothetical protein